MVTIDFKYELNDNVSYYNETYKIKNRIYMESRGKGLIKYSLEKYNKYGELEEYIPSVSESLLRPAHAKLRLIK